MASFTCVKLVGASQVFTTMQGWEDGAPANLTTAEKWNAGSFVGTFTQGETVTGVGLTSGKFLDSDGSSYVSFGIVSGNSNTLVTLTGSTSGATCVVSLKTNTGCIWQGQVNAASDAFTAILSMSGSTASSTAYKQFTTKAGASFRDHASVQTNALAYDATKGASSSRSGSNSCLTIAENYGRVSNMQFTSAGTGGIWVAGINNCSGARIDNCIIRNTSTGKTLSMFANSVGNTSTVTNCLAYRSGSGSGPLIDVDNYTACVAVNCTFAVCSDQTKASVLYTDDAYNVGIAAKNCAFFGITDIGINNDSYTTCYTDDASPPTGATTITYDTSTGSGFTGTTAAAADFKIKTGSAMVDTGTTDSTNAATDIVGTARPSGSAYDVGCWELVQAGGGGGITATLTQTLGALTSTSACTLAIAATATNTLGALTSNAAGTLAIAGSDTSTLGMLTSGSAVTLAIAVVSTNTLGALTSSAAGTLAVACAFTQTLGALTCSSTASLNRYWVGGTGNWSDDTNHWALTSGGSPGSGNLPTSSSNAIFDANSGSAGYTVTINATAACRNLNFSAAPAGSPSETITWAGTSAITISGSLTCLAGMVRSYTGTKTFDSSRAETITSNGVTFGAGSFTFNGTGSWTLQDAFTTTSTITLTKGSLDTNSFSVSSRQFLSTGSNTRSLTLGATSWTIPSGGFIPTPWDVTSSLVISAGTSTIYISDNTTQTFSGAGLTYNNIVMTGYVGNRKIFAGSNTFKNISFVNDGTTDILEFTSGTNTSFESFSVNGTGSHNVTLRSTGGSPSSPFTLTKIGSPTENVVCDYLDIYDSTAVGTNFFAGAHSVDKGGNTGWIFSSNAALTQTLGALTCSSTATLAIVCSLTQTLGACTLSSIASFGGITVDLSKTLGALTSTSACALAIAATSTNTLGALTSNVAGTLAVAGTCAQTLGALTSSSAATVAIACAFTKTLGACTLSSTASSLVSSADLSKTLGLLTSNSVCALAIAAISTNTLGALTCSAAATLKTAASLAQTLGACALSSDCNMGNARTASLTVTLGALTLSSRVTGLDIGQSTTLGGGKLYRRQPKQIRLIGRFTGVVLPQPVPPLPPDIQAGLNVTLGELTLTAHAILAETVKQRQRRRALLVLLN